jgi:lysophospholipase
VTVPVTVRADGRFTGVGGLRLYYRVWQARTPAATLLLVHGLSDHSGRFEAVGADLSAAGISTWAMDLRGHGASEGRRGHAGSFDWLLQDLERFRLEVLSLTGPDLPVFLLGHSMGGLIALRYLEEFDSGLRGGILSAPWLATALPVPPWKTALAGVLSRFLPALPFRTGIDPADLSRDPDVVRAYREDPLVHQTLTPRLHSEATAAMRLVRERAGRLHTPLLFLVPGNDRIVDTEETLSLARSLPATGVTTRVFPGAFHEVLNEPDRRLALRLIRDWIVGQLSA